MTAIDLDGRNFVPVADAAEVLDHMDPRTVRAAAAAGEIPAVRVGARWMIPTAWLRQQINGGVQPTEPELDLDQLAERVADRVIARFASLFAGPQRQVESADVHPSRTSAA